MAIDGLVYSKLYFQSESKSQPLLCVNSRDHLTLANFAETFNNDTSPEKTVAKHYFLEHIVKMIPPGEECTLINGMKSIYIEISQRFLWDQDVPANALTQNEPLIGLTNQFFAKLNSQINLPPQ
jgi:hypothetical protein